uniref:Pre-C2HC domain-containing protein n=1 Tax=Anopheles culicifacies TaxID=139723 RepID=A0A182M140_9DIPT
MASWQTVGSPRGRTKTKKRKRSELPKAGNDEDKETIGIGRKRVASRNLAATMAAMYNGNVKVKVTPASEADMNTIDDGARTTTETTLPGKDRIPPIMVRNINEEQYSSLCASAHQGEIVAFFNFTADNFCRITCKTRKDHEAVKCLLASYNLEFFTHDFPADKPFQVMLKGLRFGNATLVKSLIKERGFHPIQVRELQIGATSKTASKMFVVAFKKGITTLEEVQTIDYLNYTSVKWERYMPRRDEVQQCQNCLSFGHGSNNCAMHARCAKCAGKHLTRQCGVELEDKRICANCSGNHSPRNPNCPARVEYLKKKNASKVQTTKQRFVPAPLPRESAWHQPLQWMQNTLQPKQQTEAANQHICMCPGCPKRVVLQQKQQQQHQQQLRQHQHRQQQTRHHHPTHQQPISSHQ